MLNQWVLSYQNCESISREGILKTSMKWNSYQISMSYNELYLINSGISGREREKERDKFCVISVKYKEIS